jgi:hypothetical protein
MLDLHRQAPTRGSTCGGDLHPNLQPSPDSRFHLRWRPPPKSPAKPRLEVPPTVAPARGRRSRYHRSVKSPESKCVHPGGPGGGAPALLGSCLMLGGPGAPGERVHRFAPGGSRPLDPRWSSCAGSTIESERAPAGKNRGPAAGWSPNFLWQQAILPRGGPRSATEKSGRPQPGPPVFPGRRTLALSVPARGVVELSRTLCRARGLLRSRSRSTSPRCLLPA